MDIHELRIGNYVEVEGKPAVVVALVSNSIDHIKVSLPDGRKTDINLSDVMPMKFTNELLASCCKFDISGRHTIGMDNHRYFLKIEEGGYISVLNKENEALIHFWDVRHLHQLQNLYYALKNEEMAVSFS